MDPFLAMAIGGGIPTLFNMFNQPQMPNMSPVNNINWGQLSPYSTTMLNNAFNPNDYLLNIALNKSQGAIGNQMTARGMGGSSMADAAMRQSATDITNQWIGNQTQRQAQAYGAVAGGLGAQAGVAEAQNKDAWNQYLQGVANRNGSSQGIGQLLGLGLAGLFGNPSGGGGGGVGLNYGGGDGYGPLGLSYDSSSPDMFGLGPNAGGSFAPGPNG